MAEYIERQAALEVVNGWREQLIPTYGENDEYVKCLETVAENLDIIHASEVRPVVRGRWILDSDPGEPWKYKCDQCGEVTNNTCMGKPRYNYCPMCGAYMGENDA